MRVDLRPVTLDDISILRTWDAEPDRDEWAGTDGPWEWEAEIPIDEPWKTMWIAERGGLAIGFVQLLETSLDETNYWGEDAEKGTWAIDLWIGDPVHRGGGIGSQIMSRAIEILEECGASRVLVDPLIANRRAHAFYEACGFAPIGERSFGADRCLVFERRLDQ